MSQPPPQPPANPPDQPYGYPQQQPYAQPPQYGDQQPQYGDQQPYAQQQPYPQQQQAGWGQPDAYGQSYAQPYADPYGGQQAYPGAQPYQQPYGGYADPANGYADPRQAYGAAQPGYPQAQGYGQPQPPQQPQPQQQPYAAPPQPAYEPQQPYAEPLPPQTPYGEPAVRQPAPPEPAGYPPQPPYPDEQGLVEDPGGGPAGNRKLYLMVAGIVALVVLIGGGIWLMTSGGGSSQQASGGAGGVGPHNTQGELRWTVKAPTVSKAQIVSPTPGMWFAGKNVVKQSTTAVTAYDLATGHTAWTVPAPAGHTCQASSTAAGGKVAVQYGAHCEDLMAVDLSTGKMLWHKPLAAGKAATYVYSNADLAVSGSTVAVAWDDNAAAFDLSNGKQRWKTSAGGSCQDQGFAGGTQMVEVYKCGLSDDPPYHVRLIDPVTGKAKWTWDAPAGTQVTNVISVDPVVIGLGAGDDLITDIWNIDGGRLHGKITLGKTSDDIGKYGIHCPAVQLTPCQNVAVSGDTLYMATHARSSGKQDGALTNEVAAFDLTTGSPKWLSKSGPQPYDVVTTIGSTVVAYQEPGYDTPGQIVGINTTTHALATLTTFSADTQKREHDAYGPGVTGLDEQYQNGTFAISLTEVDSSGEYPTLLAVLR
jgi:hypothetical protein